MDEFFEEFKIRWIICVVFTALQSWLCIASASSRAWAQFGVNHSGDYKCILYSNSSCHSPILDSTQNLGNCNEICIKFIFYCIRRLDFAVAEQWLYYIWLFTSENERLVVNAFIPLNAPSSAVLAFILKSFNPTYYCFNETSCHYYWNFC